MTTTRTKVAAMLRAGATYRQISAATGASHSRISQIRQVHNIPTTRRRPATADEVRAVVAQRYPHVAEMLRGGATYRQISAATGITHPTIARVRRVLNIPSVPRTRTARTISDALDGYLQPYGTHGHARWTGPHAGPQPELWANGRRYNARRQIFAAHYGRIPDGNVLRSCTEPGCLAGPHLTDRHIRRHRNTRLNHLYTAIFGTETPS